jgi:cytochrome P450
LIFGRREALVLLTDIDLASHDFFVDAFPHEAFRLLREHDPVHWQPEPPPNHGFWAITKYHDVETVIDDPGTFSSERGGVILEEMAPDELEARKSMMETDPPRHTRMRKIASPLFTPRAMKEYEGYCRDIARDVLDKALAKGEFDFVLEVAKELPIRVLVRILGVPDKDTDRLIEWGDTMIGNTDPEYTSLVIDRDDTSDYRLMPFRSPAAADMMNYGHRMAEIRQGDPQSDLVTKLVHAEVDGDRLSTRDFDNFFVLLVVAGNETTRNGISHGMQALMDNPDQLKLLQDEPTLIAGAVEEMLRWGSPTIMFRRTATRDTELRGVQIRENDKVVVWFASANYDEEVFPDPFRFDVTRTPNRHFAFGAGGPHFCLGAPLARLEMRVMFEELLPRIRGMESAGEVSRLRSNFINGIKHMPIRILSR